MIINNTLDKLNEMNMQLLSFATTYTLLFWLDDRVDKLIKRRL